MGKFNFFNIFKKKEEIKLLDKGPDINVAKFSGGSAYLTKGTKIRIYKEI